MTTENLIFEEKQYLGRNPYWLNRRLVLAAFCFVAYWITNDKETENIFLIVGSSILVISAILFYIIHYKTLVYTSYIFLDGLWTSKRVKIDLNNIVSCQKEPYSNYLLNNPVYNLHKKGTIRFYAGGKDAVKLVDKDGLIYMIGSQQAEQLAKTIKPLIGR